MVTLTMAAIIVIISLDRVANNKAQKGQHIKDDKLHYANMMMAKGANTAHSRREADNNNIHVRSILYSQYMSHK